MCLLIYYLPLCYTLMHINIGVSVYIFLLVCNLELRCDMIAKILQVYRLRCSIFVNHVKGFPALCWVKHYFQFYFIICFVFSIFHQVFIAVNSVFVGLLLIWNYIPYNKFLFEYLSWPFFFWDKNIFCASKSWSRL